MLLAVAGFATTPHTEWWSQGNKMYAAKQYAEAAEYYSKIAALNPQDEEVYYNLGNAYYRLNNISMAVLNYEKALKIDPDHKEAADNLLITQSRIKNRIPTAPDIFFVRWWNVWTSAGKATMWAVLSLLVFLSIIAMLALSRMGKLKKLPPAAMFISSLVLCCLLVLAFAAAINKTANDRAVVMQADIRMMSNPGGGGKQQAVVPEGTTVELLGEQAGWAEVQLPDGRTGYMQKDALTKI
jgi:tetratricopeptide (TPR) repeat protein